MSFAVSAGAVRPPPIRLMPLLLDSVPPITTRVTIRGPSTASTSSRIRPSLSSSTAPRVDVARQLLVVEADARRVAQLALRVEDERLPRLQRDLAVGELADADLRALQVRHDARPRGRALRAHSRTRRARSTWSDARPCEKLRRTTSTPAASIACRTAGSLHAGPSVATILVLRGTGFLGGFAVIDRRMLREFAARETTGRVECATAGARRPHTTTGRETTCALQQDSRAASSPRPRSRRASPPPTTGRSRRRSFTLPAYTTVGGKAIANVKVGYETYGKLNAAGDNAIFVAHFFSGTSHAAGKYAPSDAAPGYWDPIIGAGRPIDTDKYFVISADTLTNLNTKDPNVVTTGPATHRPRDGKAVRDGVSRRFDARHGARAQGAGRLARREEAAGGRRRVGGSIQAMEWAALYPGLRRSASCTSSARASTSIRTSSRCWTCG